MILKPAWARVSILTVVVVVLLAGLMLWPNLSYYRLSFYGGGGSVEIKGWPLPLQYLSLTEYEANPDGTTVRKCVVLREFRTNLLLNILAGLCCLGFSAFVCEWYIHTSAQFRRRINFYGTMASVWLAVVALSVWNCVGPRNVGHERTFNDWTAQSKWRSSSFNGVEYGWPTEYMRNGVESSWESLPENHFEAKFAITKPIQKYNLWSLVLDASVAFIIVLACTLLLWRIIRMKGKAVG